MRIAAAAAIVAIALVACHKQQDLVNLPDVTKTPTYATEAMHRLQNLGFRTQLESRITDSIAPGYVLARTPQTEQEPRGAFITLIVAARDPGQFALPKQDETRLSERTEEELRRYYMRQMKSEVPDVSSERIPIAVAIHRLQNFGFRVAVNTKLDPQQRAGTVIGQLPPPKTELRWGSDVVITATVTQPYEPRLSEEDAIKLSQVAEESLKTMFDSMPAPVAPPAPQATEGTYILRPDVLKHVIPLRQVP